MSRGFRDFGAELTENPLGIESCDDAGLNTPRGMTGVIAAADPSRLRPFRRGHVYLRMCACAESMALC